MSNLQSVYNKTLALLHEIEEKDNFIKQVRKPKLPDKSLLALTLAAETLGIDSEHFLFKQLPPEVEGLIEPSVYNRRVRRLSFKLEDLRQKMIEEINPNTDLYIVDSMPLEICKFSRANRSEICINTENKSPDFGFCASQNFHYYGYKLHAVCTPEGIVKRYDISKASDHDIHYLNDIQSQLENCILIGDKGYLSKQWQHNLFEDSKVNLQTPMRKNQLDYKEFPHIFSKARKRIETLFSQLCDQFMIRRNYAKSFEGISRRVITKMTSLTLIQWVNQRSGNKLNNLKIVIS